MLVVDTSAIVTALLGRPALPDLNGRLEANGDLHAPHLIDVELLHALRRLLAADAVSADPAWSPACALSSRRRPD